MAQVVIQDREQSLPYNTTSGDLARFIKLDTTGVEIMLYATQLDEEMILALAFDAQTPFSRIRAQAGTVSAGVVFAGFSRRSPATHPGQMKPLPAHMFPKRKLKRQTKNPSCISRRCSRKALSHHQPHAPNGRINVRNANQCEASQPSARSGTPASQPRAGSGPYEQEAGCTPGTNRGSTPTRPPPKSRQRRHQFRFNPTSRRNFTHQTKSRHPKPFAFRIQKCII